MWYVENKDSINLLNYLECVGFRFPGNDVR